MQRNVKGNGEEKRDAKCKRSDENSEETNAEKTEENN